MSFMRRTLLSWFGFFWLVWLVAPAQATVLATNMIIASDPVSGGSIQVISTVRDDFFGDSSLYQWDYQVLNLDFDPTPGTSNALSGFQIVFAAAVAGLTQQYAPGGWSFNCCGTLPPFGAEADISNSEGSGILPWHIGNFGFATPAGIGWTDTDQGSWAHTWETDVQQHVFDLVDVKNGHGLLVPTPEPGTLLLLALALIGVSSADRWYESGRNSRNQ